MKPKSRAKKRFKLKYNQLNVRKLVIDHLKKLRVSGGTSNKVANFPIIKFPDQNRAARVRKV